MSTIEKFVKPSEFLRFQTEYASGKFEHLRFGQAFCNHFNVRGDQTLFYTENRHVAQRIIWDYYIDGD